MRSLPDDKLEALPDELRGIVIYDRELDAIRAAAVPDLARFQTARECRAAWRESAVARWGTSVRGDGPGRRA